MIYKVSVQLFNYWITLGTFSEIQSAKATIEGMHNKYGNIIDEDTFQLITNFEDLPRGAKVLVEKED